jgi:phosphate transport system substrate-binding protein
LIKRILGTTTIAGLVLSAAAAGQSPRDYIYIVGSSTVYPFATVVAEAFGQRGGFKTPKIESTGTGGGFKLFCAGVGVEHPDIANASRPIKPAEIQTCAQNKVTDIVEVKIGYDGIVLANSKSAPHLQLTRKDIYLALAKRVPDPKGGAETIANPYTTWKQVNAQLPDTNIEVLGPPPTSGTRDAFAELAMEGGCSAFPAITELKAKDENAYKALCQSVREDGKYIEAGENDNLIVQKLEANPKAVGIFGYSFLEQNEDKVQGSFVDGVEPSFESISSGKYSVSRPLFFYVKKAHVGVIPGLKEYIAEFTRDSTWGPEGYLADRGLIPMPDAERATVTRHAAELAVMRVATQQ